MSFLLREDLIELVKTYSPTGHESAAVEKFNRYLKQCGAQNVGTDRVGNSIGTFSGKEMSVLLCGHIDTVPGRLPTRVKGNTLHGRGAVDAKSSLMALLHGAKMAKDQGFIGTLHVAAAVGEEGPSKGIIEIASVLPKTDFAIFGEPSGTTGITAGYRGRILMDLNFRSGSFHASAPWMGQNAVDMAIDGWRRVQKEYGGNREFSKVSAALTSIHGGDATNVTPSNASITLDVRYPPSRNMDELVSEIREMLFAGMEEGTGSLTVKSFVYPYVSNLRNPLVQAFKKSITGKGTEKPQIIFKSGSGDMNILGSSWNIPSITYGPGNPQLSHTKEEIIDLDEVQKSAEIVSEALLNLEKIN